MKLLYVIDSLVASGGAEQAVAAMAPGLERHGVRLTVVPLSDRAGLQDRLRASGAQVLPAPSGSRRAQLGQLVALLRRTRPDLVHTTLFESDLLGRTAAAVAGIPVVSSLVNASYGREHRSDPGVRVHRMAAAQALDALTARRVRRFHALTEHVADCMARRLVIPRSRIDVIPRGRDAALLGTRSAGRTAHVRRRLGVPLGVPLIAAAARHEHQKGLDVLVQAFGQLLRVHPDAHLAVAGREGNATSRLQEAVAQLEHPHRVHLLGLRDDVPDLLAAADVLAVPSRWEGLGSTALEGMGLGLPVVASDIPALRETLGCTACAWLVPPDDPDRLRAALEEALTDEGRVRGARAQARFDQRYEIAAVVQQMHGFYARALENASSRPA